MNTQLPPAMAEVLRLTLAGRPADATAAIQRTLAGGPPRVTLLDHADTPDGVQPASGLPRMRALPGAVRPTVSTSPDIQSGGRYLSGTYSGPAGTLGYKLYVPSGYTGQAVPLVVMLHGCTQSADDSAAGTRLNEFAEQEPWLIAYPEQTTSANPSRCWNWFEASHQLRDQGEPSLIAGITRQVMAEYRVDSQRVYVVGMSAGGAMAAIVGETYPELYAAVGVHSGLARGAAHDLRSAMAAMHRGGPEAMNGADPGLGTGLPLIVFHGDRDKTVHPRNAQRVLARVVRPSTGESNGRVTVSEGQVAGGRSFTRTQYHDAHAQVVAEHWLVHASGHAWSGGNSAGSFTDPHGPDATAEMLRFFREHPKR